MLDKRITLEVKQDSKCLHYFMAAMLTPLAWAPTWRSHPKRYKFMSDIQANNSSAEMATDLKFKKDSTIAHSFLQSIYEDNDEKRRRLQPT